MRYFNSISGIIATLFTKLRFNMPNKTIILASSSKYRAELLKKIIPTFECQSPDIDESVNACESAEQLALRLSIEKANAVAKSADNNSIIIASDQTACVNDKILNKPGSFDKAFEQLSEQSGNKVDFYTGLSVLDTETGKQLSDIVIFTVYFRDLTEQEIENYLKKEQPYDCAGSFKSEGLGIALFEKMQGDDPNSLIGLPLIKLNDFLRKLGLNHLILPN